MSYIEGPTLFVLIHTFNSVIRSYCTALLTEIDDVSHCYWTLLSVLKGRRIASCLRKTYSSGRFVVTVVLVSTLPQGRRRKKERWRMCTVRKSWTISRSDVTADRSVFCHSFKQNNNSLKHQNLPARVDKGAAEKEAVRCRLVHKPIKHHLPVPRTDGHSEFEARAVALRQQVHHFHVKGHG